MAEPSVQSPAEPLGAARAAYLQALDALDREAAIAQIRQLSDTGHSLATVVTEVLTPAQIEVGRRWEDGERSVAWEHAATSITECALLSLPATRPAPPMGRVTVMCAEGEGHSVPVRMQAQLLASLGWDPILLIPPLDAAYLAEFLGRHPVDAVALSCSLTGHLPGCLGLIEAAHQAGVPVLAGGGAFGNDDARARRLGIDHRTDDAAEAAERMATWRSETATSLARAEPADPEHARLAEAGPAIMEDAMTVLAREYPGWPADWSETDAAREDYRHAVSLLAAAILVEDVTVVTDGLAWRRRYWQARSEPADAMTTRLHALAESIPPAFPRARGLLAGALGA